MTTTETLIPYNAKIWPLSTAGYSPSSAQLGPGSSTQRSNLHLPLAQPRAEPKLQHCTLIFPTDTNWMLPGVKHLALLHLCTWGYKLPKKSQCSVTMSWGRQHTPIPEQSTEGSPRPASSPEPPALIPSPRLRSPGHPWSKWENVMYLTTTPETERVSWKGDMEDPQEWMKQFFPSGTNKIQHDNEENTFGFYPFTMQLSSRIRSSTSPCQLLSLGQLFRFDFSFLTALFSWTFLGHCITMDSTELVYDSSPLKD